MRGRRAQFRQVIQKGIDTDLDDVQGVLSQRVRQAKPGRV